MGLSSGKMLIGLKSIAGKMFDEIEAQGISLRVRDETVQRDHFISEEGCLPPLYHSMLPILSDLGIPSKGLVGGRDDTAAYGYRMTGIEEASEATTLFLFSDHLRKHLFPEGAAIDAEIDITAMVESFEWWASRQETIIQASLKRDDKSSK